MEPKDLVSIIYRVLSQATKPRSFPPTKLRHTERPACPSIIKAGKLEYASAPSSHGADPIPSSPSYSSSTRKSVPIASTQPCVWLCAKIRKRTTCILKENGSIHVPISSIFGACNVTERGFEMLTRLGLEVPL
jgi:hypothetical protein